jgi:hypothetical protein
LSSAKLKKAAPKTPPLGLNPAPCRGGLRSLKAGSLFMESRAQ